MINLGVVKNADNGHACRWKNIKHPTDGTGANVDVYDDGDDDYGHDNNNNNNCPLLRMCCEFFERSCHEVMTIIRHNEIRDLTT